MVDCRKLNKLRIALPYEDLGQLQVRNGIGIIFEFSPLHLFTKSPMNPLGSR